MSEVPLPPESPEIRVGISSCLLGMEVRFDGGHKHDTFITQVLGQFFQWVSVCPEMEMGLGTPRETLRLQGDVEDPILIAPKSGADHTDAMKRFNESRLKQLAEQNLHGYILKKNSPSCGMERVRVYGEEHQVKRSGKGLFARALMNAFPLLPVEEEGRLHDPLLRENFIGRVYSYYRLQQLIDDDPRPNDLVTFHRQHKLTLMAHNVERYRQLGKLVARAGVPLFAERLEEYGEQFMMALSYKATPRKHANVLYHVMGYFKKALDGEDRQELGEIIEQYRTGYVPLIVPVTLLKHHLRRHPVPWLEEQVYLNPYPAELKLRNSV